MFRRFFKIFFFTSLVIAALIAGVSLLDSTTYKFASLLTKIGYSTHAEISTAVVALFPITATILCGIITLLTSAIIRQPAESLKKSKFYLYYFVSLIVISLLVLLPCIIKFNISFRYVWTGDVAIIGLLYGVCIVEALVVAGFLVSFFTLWKTHRFVAAIIGVIILLIIPANYISGYATYEASNYSPYSSNNYNLSYRSSPSADLPVQEYIEEEMYEDYPDDVDENYLSFFWSEGEYDVSGAANVLFNYGISAWNAEYPQTLLSDIEWTLYSLKENNTDSHSGKIADESEKRISLNKIYAYLIEHPSEAIEALVSYREIIQHYMPYLLSNFMAQGHISC
ncbi:MAG: hypothetical protein LBG19_07745 [Prevotellaceae bacterium]|jgi:membrane protease YdiL (CAAX protease family)|nr:hypothetical protein [Prevotellaceae bacterium]